MIEWYSKVSGEHVADSNVANSTSNETGYIYSTVLCSVVKHTGSG